MINNNQEDKKEEKLDEKQNKSQNSFDKGIKHKSSENSKINIENDTIKTVELSPVIIQNSLQNEEALQFYPTTIKDKIKFYFYLKILPFMKKYKKDIILSIINISGIIIYAFSLRGCEGDPTECTIKRGFIFYITIGILTIISCLLISTYLAFAIYTCSSFYHLIYLIPIYIFFFTQFTGTDAVDHGTYNSIGFIFFLFVLVPLVIFILKIIKLIREKEYRKLAIIFIIIAIIIFLYNTIPNFSCENWDRGLNNTFIDNDLNKYACKIVTPRKNKCMIDSLDGVFDFSKIFRPSCSAKGILKNEKKIFLKNIGTLYNNESKLNHFGYPITARDKFSMEDKGLLKEYMHYVNKETIKMDLFDEKHYPNEPKPEVELFFDENNYGHIKMNVIFNETLSRERNEIAKTKKTLYDNVLIIYIDAISRNQFKRKLGKLANLIEPYMKYEKNYEKKKFSAFQFMKYNTVKGLTLPNIKAMFYGIQLDEKIGTNYVKYYKDQGFITGHTGTTCGREIFSINSLILDQDLDYNSFDHENIAMFCDPNFFDYRYPLHKGVASVIKRCLYGKYGFEYAMEYSLLFWKTYPNNKKMYRVHFNEGHEGTMELVSYLEDPLYIFVKKFFDEELLNNTIIFFVSDHGNHMLGPWQFIRPDDYLLESTLATLFIMVPNNDLLYNSGIYNNLYDNQQVFITPYDIHDTLIHLALNDNIDNKGDLFYDVKEGYSRRGASLLNKINPLERYCENPKFDYKIAPSDCKCKLPKKKKK